LAAVTPDGPTVHPNLFAFAAAERSIYLHLALTGATRAAIEADPRVSFTAYEMGRLLPATSAFGVSVEYASVIVSGQAEIVTDPETARHGLQLLMDKYFAHLTSGRDYRPIQPSQVAETTVLRVAIAAWSGKRHQAAPDFPGAFVYGAPPEARP
jgi:nitroimidazol reductase NimA-like FMN-containing flavoprotein (pyridoxamine 5'-phosphate oxidase superfamily)